MIVAVSVSGRPAVKELALALIETEGAAVGGTVAVVLYVVFVCGVVVVLADCACISGIINTKTNSSGPTEDNIVVVFIYSPSSLG